MGGQILVEQAERVRQRLGGHDLQLAAGVPAGQEGVLLATAVADQHGALPRSRGQAGRGGVRDVVADEPGPSRVQAGQFLGEELRCERGVPGAQLIPRVVKAHVRGRAHQGRVVGEADQVDIGGAQPGLAQAPAGGHGRLFPGREGHRPLAVLAAAEAFFLGGGHHHAVDHERGRRVVEDGVDAENPHACLPSLSWA